MSIAQLPVAAPRGPLTHCSHVLIVNRDPALLETARGVLERAGSNVTATNAIRSAAAMSALLGPDLIDVDLKLDLSDLAIFAERLAINPHLRSIPLILTSTDSDMFARAAPMRRRAKGRVVFRGPLASTELDGVIRAYTDPD
ncbi:MAG TPA: hypothetical protein VFQ80_08725 [Thermomicrobiales bacterium]|nr:hypothetical protein [Thermomicrobiales bacterium]